MLIKKTGRCRNLCRRRISRQSCRILRGRRLRRRRDARFHREFIQHRIHLKGILRNGFMSAGTARKAAAGRPCLRLFARFLHKGSAGPGHHRSNASESQLGTARNEFPQHDRSLERCDHLIIRCIRVIRNCFIHNIRIYNI